MRRKRRAITANLLALAAASAYFVRPAALFAATPTNYLFTNSSGGSWATPGNWSPTGPANGADNTATFVQSTGASYVGVTLDSSPTIGNMSFSSATGYGWTINPGAGGTLTLATSAGAAPTISLAGQQHGEAVNIDVPLAGSDGLSFSGVDAILNLHASNTYTGTTVVSSASTPPITVALYPGAALASQNIVVSGATFQNVATGGVEPTLAAPSVSLNGGNFENTITDNSNSYSLAVGNLNLGSGFAGIVANGAGQGQTAQLSFATMTRQVGTLVYFENGGTPSPPNAQLIGNSTQNTISINGAAGPALTNGILPYATVNYTDWATYSDALGTPSIVAYSGYQTSTNDAAWSTTDNVELTSSLTLTASRSINSINLNSTPASQGPITLDLGGANNTLTLDSGGLLIGSEAPVTLQNGNLTSGAASGELIIHNPASYDFILANSLRIVDNGTTPVTVTMNGGGPLFWNSTSNTYTGNTIVAIGNVSLPTGYADGRPGSPAGVFGAVPATLNPDDIILDADSGLIGNKITFAATRGIEIGPAQGLGGASIGLQDSTINGPISNNGQGIGALMAGSDSVNGLTLKGDDTYSGGTTIGAGILTFAAVDSIPAVGSVVNKGVLSIECGTIAQPAVLPNLTGTGNLTVGTASMPAYLRLAMGSGTNSQTKLLINPGSIVDITDNTLLLNDNYNATIRGYLQSAYNNSTWTGTGLTSSIAAVNPGRYAVGYADGNLDAGTPAGANQLLIQTTIAGDANLDGLVNFSDLLVVAQDYGRTGQDWAHGDFNYDGLVNFSDLLLVAQNYGQQLSSGQLAQLPGSFAAQWQLAESEINDANVPEPAAVGLLLVGAAVLLPRQRRRG